MLTVHHHLVLNEINLHSSILLRGVLGNNCIARAERDGTRAETRFRLSPKWTSPFKSAGALVQSTAGSRGVRISLSNSGYTTFGVGVRVLATHSIRLFPLHFPSRASPCATRFRTSSTFTFKTIPLQGLGRPFGLQEVEALRISKLSTQECGDVSHTHRPPLTPQEIFLVRISVRTQSRSEKFQ